VAVWASQTGIYYARTLFVMGDEKVRKYNPKKLERKLKSRSGGLRLPSMQDFSGVTIPISNEGDSCLFRPQTGYLATLCTKGY
jgi:hypothetical protein